MLHLLPSLLLFAALAILRFSLVGFLNLSSSEAWTMGVAAGLLTDFAFAFFPFAALLVTRSRVLGIGFAVLLWTGAFANAAYFKFFQAQLDLWVVFAQGDQVYSIRKVITNLARDATTLASFACFVAAAVLFATRRRPIGSRAVVAGLALVAASLLVRKSQDWLHLPEVRNSVVHDNVFYRWSQDLKEQGWQAVHHARDFQDVKADAKSYLKTYAAMGTNVSIPHESEANPKRLVYRFEAEREHAVALRERLGFASNQKLNVVLLFLESARALEYLHPELGPEVYPNLRGVMREHGVLFEEAYSSASITINGQYTALCSELARQQGPPVYVNYPYLQIKCLPSLFVENDYETYWMNPYHRFFGGKFLFETNHGTQNFFDREFYGLEDSPAQEATEWGVSDRIFYEKSFRKLTEIHAKGQPFFAHLLNVGTHAPYSGRPHVAEVSPALAERTAPNPEHLGYLRSVKDMDAGLGLFFQNFFASPMADDTVVMIVSDHGTGVIPAYPQLSAAQKNLLTPRILFGLVSKRMNRPEVNQLPVNQMDMAPMIATVADLKGSVAWLGRDPFRGSGTPWIAEKGGLLSYRMADHYCAQLMDKPKMQCWRLTLAADPLIEVDLKEKAEERSLSEHFRRIIRSNEVLVETGMLMDPPDFFQ
jgi:phosphoglycerol transferase MdoB-like AlkP superfamily enzyme